jgi:hypothetical protein
MYSIALSITARSGRLPGGAPVVEDAAEPLFAASPEAPIPHHGAGALDPGHVPASRLEAMSPHGPAAPA